MDLRDPCYSKVDWKLCSKLSFFGGLQRPGSCPLPLRRRSKSTFGDRRDQPGVEDCSLGFSRYLKIPGGSCTQESQACSPNWSDAVQSWPSKLQAGIDTGGTGGTGGTGALLRPRMLKRRATAVKASPCAVLGFQVVQQKRSRWNMVELSLCIVRMIPRRIYGLYMNYKFYTLKRCYSTKVDRWHWHASKKDGARWLLKSLFPLEKPC